MAHACGSSMHMQELEARGALKPGFKSSLSNICAWFLLICATRSDITLPSFHSECGLSDPGPHLGRSFRKAPLKFYRASKLLSSLCNSFLIDKNLPSKKAV